MGILTALGTGIRRTNRSMMMVLILYCLNIILAAPLALAFQSAIVTRLGNSDALRGMLSDFQFQVFDEFLQYYGGDLAALFRQMLWLLLIAMVFSTLTAGGILTRHREGEMPFSVRSFFAGCGEYAGRFLRLLFLVLPVLFVVALLWGGVLSLAFSGFSDAAASEVSLLTAALITLLFFLLPVGFLLVVFDYARTILVIHADHSVLTASRTALGFVLRNLFPVAGLQILLLLLALLFFAVYVLLDLTIGMSDTITVILMTVVGQMYLGLKMWIRSVSYGAQLSLYESRKNPAYALESIELTPPLPGL